MSYKRRAIHCHARFDVTFNITYITSNKKTFSSGFPSSSGRLDHSTIWTVMLAEGSNLQPHIGMLLVAKRLIA